MPTPARQRERTHSETGGNLLAVLAAPFIALSFFFGVVRPIVRAFIPENPSDGDVERILLVTFLLVVTIWVVGPLGAWRRWWRSFWVYGLCSGSIVVLTLMAPIGVD